MQGTEAPGPSGSCHRLSCQPSLRRIYTAQVNEASPDLFRPAINTPHCIVLLTHRAVCHFGEIRKYEYMTSMYKHVKSSTQNQDLEKGALTDRHIMIIYSTSNS